MRQDSDASPFCDHNPRAWPLVLTATVICVSLAHLTVGCEGHSPNSASQESTPSGQQSPQVEETQPAEPESTLTPTVRYVPREYIVETGIGAPDNLNPLAEQNDASQAVTRKVFDSLLRVNATNAALEPALAAAWEVSEDFSSVTFHLRSGILWHDGQPFTARDVEFTFESVEHAASVSPYRANLVNVRSFSATGSHTFVVDLKSPDCSVLYDIGQIPIVPRHRFENASAASQEDTSANLHLDQPVGTGPYRFKDRLPTGEVHFERNESYFAGVPQVPRWVYQPAADQAQLLDSLRSGQADLAIVPAENAQELQQSERLRLLAVPQATFYALALNNKRPSLSDVRVRQALAHAINRAQLVQELLGGYGQVIESSWLPDHWAYARPDIAFAYDPNRASLLLQEAGWVDSDGDGLLERGGNKLQVNISVNAENDLRKRIALAVQQDWVAIGVSAEVHFVEFQTLLEKLFAPNFDAAVLSWPIHQDPDQHLLWASQESELESTFNFISYSNPIVDEALQQGLTTPRCDPKLRVQAYQTAISAIIEDQPYIFLFAPQEILAVNKRVSGLVPGRYARIDWNIENWRLDEEAQ